MIQPQHAVVSSRPALNVNEVLNSIVPSIFPVAYVATEAKRHVNMHAIEDAAVLYGLLGVAHATVAPTGGQDRHAHDATLFKHKTLVQIQQDLRKGGAVKATTAYAVALLVRMEVSSPLRLFHCSVHTLTTFGG